MKLAKNNHHVSGNCWKGFQGQRSKVKVIARRDQMYFCVEVMHTFRRRGVAYEWFIIAL